MKIHLVILFNILNSISAFRVFDIRGTETILAKAGENINIRCKTETPMAYCGFIHPNGKRYSFSGSTLNAGQCAIKIQASVNDSGIWRCHIGKEGSIGLEIIQLINVRVVQELAALEKNITAVHGKPATIVCATTKGLAPLRYCRFEPPNDRPFSINSDVDVNNPILGRFYFPNNKSLDRGDCAVTIKKVKYEDVGVWTCGVGMDDGKGHIDTVTLDVEGLYTMSTASATGITFGVITVFVAILGFIVWKKRRFLGSVPAEGEAQELRHLRHGSTCGSPRVTPCASLRGSPRNTPIASLRGSPRHSPPTSLHGSTHLSPIAPLVGSTHLSPITSQREGSPHISPVAPLVGSTHLTPITSLQGGSPRITTVTSLQGSAPGSAKQSPRPSAHVSPSAPPESSSPPQHPSAALYPTAPEIVLQSPSNKEEIIQSPNNKE